MPGRSAPTHGPACGCPFPLPLEFFGGLLAPAEEDIITASSSVINYSPRAMRWSHSISFSPCAVRWTHSRISYPGRGGEMTGSGKAYSPP